jgi:hypothetical protein
MASRKKQICINFIVSIFPISPSCILFHHCRALVNKLTITACKSMGEMAGHIGSKNLLIKTRIVGPAFLEKTL